MNFESRQATSPESSICELRCPVIETDKAAIQFGNVDTKARAEEDLQGHIRESIEKGCKGAENDTRSNRLICPLYGVSVDLNT